MLVKFLEQETVAANTTHCPLLSSILPRVHPAAYAALISAAHAAGVTVMQVNSGWRTSFGSIAHRAGLGLDVHSIDSGAQHVSINRAVLTGGRGPSDYVTPRERELYTDYENKKREAEAAAKEYEEKKRRQGISPELIERAKQRRDEAAIVRDDAEMKWNRERNQNEPTAIRSLRDALSLDPGIKQILDPWYMDLNTRDPHAARPNEQCSDLEKQHNNHLHITVKEEKIL
ncbi:MAG: hypothetical protein JO002_04595 [Burkholderiaceae bacterium]|nr:hypothetical protein [Burkholderiaceae bacterium]